MTVWRFWESENVGKEWLAQPTSLSTYVEYESLSAGGRPEWRRLMVVTKSWLTSYLSNVKLGATGPLWAVIPTVLVLPDAEGEALRQILDATMQQGGFDLYSVPIAMSSA